MEFEQEPEARWATGETDIKRVSVRGCAMSSSGPVDRAKFVPNELDGWFVSEVLIHEPALMSYVSRGWPNAGEVQDICQETFMRIYIAGMSSRPACARSFLLATARNLMTDRIRRARIVSIEAMGDLEELKLVDESESPEARYSARQELRRLSEAFDRLPQKCRQVVWLRKVDELSHQEIARNLGIQIKTVENHITKGVKLLAEHMFRGGSEKLGSDGRHQGLDHGK